MWDYEVLDQLKDPKTGFHQSKHNVPICRVKLLRDRSKVILRPDRQFESMMRLKRYEASKRTTMSLWTSSRFFSPIHKDSYRDSIIVLRNSSWKLYSTLPQSGRLARVYRCTTPWRQQLGGHGLGYYIKAALINFSSFQRLRLQLSTLKEDILPP